MLHFLKKNIEYRAKLIVLSDLTQFSDITILDSNTFSIEQQYLKINELKTKGLSLIKIFEISFFNKFKDTVMAYYIAYNESNKRFYRLNGFVRNELDDFINTLINGESVLTFLQNEKWSKRKRLRFIFNNENVSIEKMNLKKLYKEFKKNGLINNSCYYGFYFSP